MYFIIIVGIFTILLSLLMVLLVLPSGFDEILNPKTIEVCITSHNQTAYTMPTYIMVGKALIPIGGGRPYQESVCDHYKTEPNPKYVAPENKTR